MYFWLQHLELNSAMWEISKQHDEVGVAGMDVWIHSVYNSATPRVSGIQGLPVLDQLKRSSWI